VLRLEAPADLWFWGLSTAEQPLPIDESPGQGWGPGRRSATFVVPRPPCIQPRTGTPLPRQWLWS